MEKKWVKGLLIGAMITISLTACGEKTSGYIEQELETASETQVELEEESEEIDSVETEQQTEESGEVETDSSISDMNTEIQETDCYGNVIDWSMDDAFGGEDFAGYEADYPWYQIEAEGECEVIKWQGEETETGYLMVEAAPVNGVVSISYALWDDNYKDYEFVLKKEHAFKAVIELPYGIWSEPIYNDPHLTLEENLTMRDHGVRLQWMHEDFIYGQAYELSEEEPVAYVNPLYIEGKKNNIYFKLMDVVEQAIAVEK